MIDLATVHGRDGPTKVIALVASAGGITAVSHVLSRLPAALPAHVVVLIHQAPDRTSHLEAILQRVCAVPVAVARDGADLGAGAVSVVPPGRHLLVRPGPRAVLIPSGEMPPNRPSADLLLATLATAVGGSAIAVVLSGGGHDGATGAAAIDACGGVVIATDEASSESFSMPSAAIRRDSIVDHVADLEAVGPLLTELVGG